MRFLLDNNLSPRLLGSLSQRYPGSSHVRDFSLARADDAVIWSLAKERGFTILSKDADFHQLSLLFGAPPKVVWLRVGNRSTNQILAVIESRGSELLAFESDENAAFFALS
ncbi:MAG: DUF5615 family PIN-like protein [Planctomycetes bacterium]|nr:DUF5615 family PIN-like protein [Planctomycetota bacterium]